MTRYAGRRLARKNGLYDAVFLPIASAPTKCLTTLIERGQSDGVVLSDIPADILADQVSAMGDGWTIMVPVEPNRFSRGRINLLERWLTNGG
jgi:hypothetical protein